MNTRHRWAKSFRRMRRDMVRLGAFCIPIVAAFSCASGVANAAVAAFIPIQCAGWQAVNFNISTQAAPGTSRLAMDRKPPVTCTPNAWGNCPHYPSKAEWRRSVLANQYVSQIWYHFSMFSTEANNDFFFLDKWNLSSSNYPNIVSESGAIGGHWLTSGTRTSSSLLTEPDRLGFISQANSISSGVTGPGFTIDTVDVQCSGFNSWPPATLTPAERTSGVLLGDGDVVYAKIYALNTHANLALWGDSGNTASADFDLFARCNALPTDTTFTARSFHSLSFEMLHLDPAQCSGGVWYIAVHSWQGAGMFNLMTTRHTTDVTLDVGRAVACPVAPGLTPATDPAFQTCIAGDRGWPAGRAIPANYWEDTVRGMYATTEGAYYVNTVRNHAAVEPAPLAANNYTSDGRCGNPPVPCQLKIDFPAPANGGQARGTVNAGYVAYVAGATNVTTREHELGHVLLGLPDQYVERFTPSYDVSHGCGYTIMTANVYSDALNVCTPTNHRQDFGHLGATPNAAETLNPSFGSLLSHVKTPDPYNFLDFTFGVTGWQVNNVP
jgi:hypothetical protein